MRASDCPCRGTIRRHRGSYPRHFRLSKSSRVLPPPLETVSFDDGVQHTLPGRMVVVSICFVCSCLTRYAHTRRDLLCEVSKLSRDTIGQDACVTPTSSVILQHHHLKALICAINCTLQPYQVRFSRFLVSFVVGGGLRQVRRGPAQAARARNADASGGG